MLTRPELQRLVEAPFLGRLLAGRFAAGPRAEDAVRLAADLVAGGCTVALAARAGAGDDGGAEQADLIARVHAAGLAGACELTVSVDRLADVRVLGAEAAAAGLGLALEGTAARVETLLADLPEARVVVPAEEPDAEVRCRALAAGRVRLQAGRGSAARLAFVRCLTVLLAGDGSPAVATSDPRLIAITGERAAWNGRPSDSWEYVMPWGVRTSEQQRLVAAGASVRVAVPSGPGVVAARARRGGRHR